ncbi:MAG: helix-turn-helix domain-containing protein [Acidobacteriota bacterium]|nr:helix-turn-helix domain-containing protein [Acidobacteriota bacterium]
MPSINKAKVIELMAKKEILTFKALAEALDISTTQLSNILSEKFEPIKSNVIELAEFLEVSPLELIKESDKEK